MAEYYAVERSSQYLAHYGVRGMRWGVRKALEKGDFAAYTKHYRKAGKKLGNLSIKANRQYQKQQAKDNLAAGAALTGLGALGGLASYGIVKGQLAAQRALAPNARSRLILHPVGLYGTSALSAGTGLGLIGASAVNAYRGSKRGNERAIKKRDRWQKEMESTFKDTPYGKLKEFKTFNKQLTRMSNVKDPQKYMANLKSPGYEKPRHKSKRK